MTYVLLLILYTSSVAAIGATALWCFTAGSHNPDAEEEVRRARSTLSQIGELVGHVMTDMSEHSQRLQDISSHLQSQPFPDPDMVVEAVSKLVHENQNAQQRLAAAEKRVQEQVRQIQSHAAQARTDPLTGLTNRRALDEELSRRTLEFRGDHRPVSVLLLDVDHFKRLNDTHGHQTGDEVLRDIARVLKQTARRTDLVARYGGEEFTIVMPETSVESATAVAERIRTRIETTKFHVGGTSLSVTVSQGSAQLLPEENEISLLRRADEALYAAKRAGRNRTYWHDGLEPRDARMLLQRSTADDVPRGQAEIAEMPEAAAPADPASGESASPSAKPLVGEISPEILNQLCNRTTFCQDVRRRVDAYRGGGPHVSVILAEIDGFDRIVAAYGLRVADGLLASVVWRIRATVDPRDTVARYGRACFAVLPAVGSRMAHVAVAERLRQEIAGRSFSVQQRSIDVTLNVGMADAVGRDDLITLLKRAEASLTGLGGPFLRSVAHGSGHGGSPRLLDDRTVKPGRTSDPCL
jgi:diguanylate cyclase